MDAIQALFSKYFLAIKVIGIVLLLALVFGAGYKVASWQLTAKANELETARASRAVAARDEAIAVYTHVAGVLAASNDDHLKSLTEAQNETNRLRARLADGASGLRLAGACPRLNATAGTTSGPTVDSGTGAELDSTARRAYFALREGIDHASAQLSACQEQLRIRTAPKK